MTIALVAVAVAAVILAVALGITARRAAVARTQAGARAEELSGRSIELTARIDQAEQEKRGSEVRATAAENRVRAAEQKATDAERRSGEAERRVAEAMRRADDAEQRLEGVELRAEGAEMMADAAEQRAEAAEQRAEAAERLAASAGGGEGPAVWDLERLRIEREWLDVVGPGVPLSRPWDGTIATVVAAELAVIRETIGTPSDLVVQSASENRSPTRAAVIARVVVELLRTLARSGEVMDVVVGPEELRVTQPVTPGETPPDLGALAEVAATAGLALSPEIGDGWSAARLQIA